MLGWVEANLYQRKGEWDDVVGNGVVDWNCVEVLIFDFSFVGLLLYRGRWVDSKLVLCEFRLVG